jgi:hypothetical protein
VHNVADCEDFEDDFIDLVSVDLKAKFRFGDPALSQACGQGVQCQIEVDN